MVATRRGGNKKGRETWLKHGQQAFSLLIFIIKQAHPTDSRPISQISVPRFPVNEFITFQRVTFACKRSNHPSRRGHMPMTMRCTKKKTPHTMPDPPPPAVLNDAESHHEIPSCPFGHQRRRSEI